MSVAVKRCRPREFCCRLLLQKPHYARSGVGGGSKRKGTMTSGQVVGSGKYVSAIHTGLLLEVHELLPVIQRQE